MKVYSPPEDFVKLARETLKPEFFEEAAPLFAAHHDEVSAYQDLPINISREMYMALEAQHVLAMFTAREDDGRLIGYCFFALTRHIHYADHLVADQLGLYVDKESRGIGWGFIRFCNEELKKLGAQSVVHHAPADSGLGAILIRDGFEFMEVVYRKKLEAS